MGTLEELIGRRLREYEPVANLLARYDGEPAVFCPAAPEDTAAGWGGAQYPRIYYTLEWLADEERRSFGTLIVRFDCLDETVRQTARLEQLERGIRGGLRDVLMSPEGAAPCCFSWVSAGPLGEQKVGAAGRELRFDTFQYPCQETAAPDPVEAMNRYIKEMYPETGVLWSDAAKPITLLSPAAPVFYCRLETVDKSRETNTVVWMSARIAVSLLCPDAGLRMKMLTALAYRLSLDREVILQDHSPMFVKQVQVCRRTNDQTGGPLVVTGEYGLLRYQERKHVLTETKLNYEKGV